MTAEDSPPDRGSVDFVRDATDVLRVVLERAGYRMDPSASQDDVWFCYFNVLRRLVPARPRRTIEASGFACPTQHAMSLAKLRSKIANGMELRPHLSTEILEADYDDMLLNDWGVHHLHLGGLPHPRHQGFVARTRDVLFAMFRANEVLLLGIHPHGRGVSPPWAKQELAELIYRAWPEVADRYRLHGVLATSEHLSEYERREARDVGMLAPLVIDGKAFVGFGGGYSSSCLSTEVVEAADDWRRRLHSMQQRALMLLPKHAAAHGIDWPEKTIAKLVVVEGRLVVCVEGVEVGFEIGEVPWPMLDAISP